MKKVLLTLTQVNYLIEESFNRGLASYQPEAENSGDPATQEPFKELYALKEELYRDFKFDQEPETQEKKVTLSQTLVAAACEAEAIIDKLVELHKGCYIVSQGEDAFDKEDETLNEEFYNRTASIIVDTMYTDNETVYLLKLERSVIHYISEEGVIDSVDMEHVDDHTLCEIADWIVENNLLENAKP